MEGMPSVTHVCPRLGLLVALVTIVASGCAGVSHISQYTPKQRNYKSPVDLSTQASETTNGSLFASAHPGNFLFADQRAVRAGDILTINVVEDANAERGANTELSRNGSAELNFSSLFGIMKLLGKSLDSKLLEGSQKSDFAGQGSTSRTDHVRATVPAIVQKVLPNGNLFIEGHRVILINDEEHHFYVSGVVRPADVTDDNSVDSSRVAEAEIEFTGKGVISEKLHPGWLQRILDMAAPF